MRREPIEIALASEARNGTNKRSRRRAMRHMSPSAAEDYAPAVDVIDEAFAGFTRVNARVTRIDAQENNDSRSVTGMLVATLSAQLDALDNQRDQIVRLLRNIEPVSHSS